MLYYIYYKNKNINNIYVYTKTKVGNSYECKWLNIKYLNDKYYAKNYTKLSFNIFEAKQVITDEKTLDKQYNKEYNKEDTFEYCIEEVKE